MSDKKKTAYFRQALYGDTISHSERGTLTLTGHEFNTILSYQLGVLATMEEGREVEISYWGNIYIKVRRDADGKYYFDGRIIGDAHNAITLYMQLIFNANVDEYHYIPGFPFGTIKVKQHAGFWYIFDMETEDMMGRNGSSGVIGGYHNSYWDAVEYAQTHYKGDYK